MKAAPKARSSGEANLGNRTVLSQPESLHLSGLCSTAVCVMQRHHAGQAVCTQVRGALSTFYPVLHQQPPKTFSQPPLTVQGDLFESLTPCNTTVCALSAANMQCGVLRAKGGPRLHV